MKAHDHPQILICAGESSGDHYGALLAADLQSKIDECHLFGIGGEAMQDAGVELLENTVNKAVFGLTEVLSSVPEMWRLIRRVVDMTRKRQPVAAVFIDYPGLNLRLAKRMKKLGIPVIYYISPKVWAWHEKRIHRVIKSVDKMLSIFDFEKELYSRYGFDQCRFVGHPIVDVLSATEVTPIEREDGIQLVGLLPGSRKSEIDRLMPVIAEAARIIRKQLPQTRFALACPPALSEEYIRAQGADGTITCYKNRTHDVIASSDCLICASGTVNLEVLWFNKPAAVVYKIAPITYRVLRKLIQIKHVSPVNILAGKEVYPEFLQDDCQAPAIAQSILAMLQQDQQQQEMIADMGQARERLGAPGATGRAADEILMTAGLR